MLVETSRNCPTMDVVTKTNTSRIYTIKQLMANDTIPFKTMFILATVILSEPIALTIIFPFIYYMVRDFGIPHEKVGYYVGFIASSFSFCQLLTSFWWGQLSDRIGRRPVLLIGLLGTALSTMLFGMSKSLIWAIVCRSCCGLLNGNIGGILN